MVGVLATRNFGRRMIAVIGVVAATVAMWSIPQMTEPDIKNWQVASAVLVIILFLSNGAALIASSTWPSMGTRYQRNESRDSAVDVWGSLDRGVDPTLDVENDSLREPSQSDPNSMGQNGS